MPKCTDTNSERHGPAAMTHDREQGTDLYLSQLGKTSDWFVFCNQYRTPSLQVVSAERAEDAVAATSYDEFDRPLFVFPASALALKLVDDD
jgi:hypothetical protein